MIPKEPIMLLSYLNTQLRDNYASLDELCADLNADKQEIVEKMAGIAYCYDEELNKFVYT